MIELTLSHPDDSRQTIKYSVSPLFELATSLYELAQLHPDPDFAQWASSTLNIFTTERLLTEWNYFLPVFLYRIPPFFDPPRTQKVMSVDEQYDYFLNLSQEEFSESLQKCLQQGSGEKSVHAIADDLLTDPDLVKNRFTLFLSSYWQLVFEAKWEELAPKFVREAEQIERALNNLDETVAFLNTILQRFHDHGNGCLLLDLDVGAPVLDKARMLTLYPSFFFTGSPSLTMHNQHIHLVYNCICRIP